MNSKELDPVTLTSSGLHVSSDLPFFLRRVKRFPASHLLFASRNDHRRSIIETAYKDRAEAKGTYLNQNDHPLTPRHRLP